MFLELDHLKLSMTIAVADFFVFLLDDVDWTYSAVLASHTQTMSHRTSHVFASSLIVERIHDKIMETGIALNVS